MKEIFSDNYSVFIGSDFQKSLNEFLSKNYFLSKKFILVDENTAKYCLPRLNKIEQLKNFHIIKIASEETNKNIFSVIKIWKKLSSLSADRKSLLINLGGGVICDLGGFAASTFKRGIDFINIPTTLLSQADASVGGKTGIDFEFGFTQKKKVILKNQIGVFNNPKVVFVCPEFLKTLSQRDLSCGFAEIIKHTLIKDKNYWKKIQRIKKIENINEDIISRSIAIKNKIVLKDPKEKNLRKVLNFGHTVGHAIESFSLQKDKKPLLHGEAVAIGMICEAYISSEISGLKKDDLQKISQFIISNFQKYKITDYKSVIQLMREDKKNYDEKINFSLLSDIGSCKINQHCSEEMITEAFDFYNNLQ